ncbi:MAG: alcohol dehydrogenase catalytic domain-containing protein, partial [Eubacteriales bacterium]
TTPCRPEAPWTPLLCPDLGLAKIKLVASGICGTDIHIHNGKIPVPFPTIIGHEFVGVVEELSDKDSENYGIIAGDRVIVDIACPCGECPLCKDGDDANCLHMGLTNGGDPETAPHFYGGYGEYNYSPVKNLFKIPDGIDAKTACIFACAGPTALHAFNLAKKAGCLLAKAKTVVVQGVGPVGAFAIMYLASIGTKNIISVTGRANEAKIKMAYKLGATEVCSLEKTPVDEVTKRIKEISDGIGADMVFEASGNPQAVPQGLGMLRNRGMYLIPGQYSNSGTVEISPQTITFNAIHIIGSSQYSQSDVVAYLAFLKVNPQLHESILSLASCYKVEDTNTAIAAAKVGENIKTMLIS